MWGKSVDTISAERYNRLPQLPEQPHVGCGMGTGIF